MQLGAALFCALTILAGNFFVGQLRHLDRFPIWRFSLIEIAVVGLMANTGSGDDSPIVYLLLGLSLVVVAATAAYGLENFNVRRTGWVALGAFVGFFVPVLVFVQQPAYWWSPLVWLVPAMLCTYVGPLNKLCHRAEEAFRSKVQQDAGTRERQLKRQKWLARR